MVSVILILLNEYFSSSVKNHKSAGCSLLGLHYEENTPSPFYLSRTRLCFDFTAVEYGSQAARRPVPALRYINLEFLGKRAIDKTFSVSQKTSRVDDRHKDRTEWRLSVPRP